MARLASLAQSSFQDRTMYSLKLVTAQPVVYSIWRERNARLFIGIRTRAKSLFKVNDQSIQNTCSARVHMTAFKDALQLWFRGSTPHDSFWFLFFAFVMDLFIPKSLSFKASLIFFFFILCNSSSNQYFTMKLYPKNMLFSECKNLWCDNMAVIFSNRLMVKITPNRNACANGNKIVKLLIY